MITTAITTVSDLLGTTESASVDELTPGMHVVAHRIGYQHHGIYIGEGKVIAYLLDTGVTVCSWEQFVDGDSVTVYEHDDAQYSADEIVQRALSRVGEDDYNLVFNNCEHFANWCITGNAKSYQVREATVTAAALATATALAIRHAHTAVRVGSAAFSAARAAIAAGSAVGAGSAAATATATATSGFVGGAAATGIAAAALPVAATVAGAAIVGAGVYAVLSNDEVRDTISDAVDSVTGAASEAFDSVSDLASDAVDTVGDFASDAVDTVGDLASDAYDTVSDLASDACDAVSDFADSVGDFFSGIFK